MCSAPSDTGGGQTRPAPAGQPSSLAETHRLAVQRHTPASMLIDRNGQILHVSERAGRYLRHPAGEPTLLLTQLVLPELRLELRLALLDAVRRGESVEAKRVHVLRDGEWVWVSISVRPVEPGQSDHLLVLFDEIQARRELPSPPDQQDGLMRQLEAELQQTQDQLLQATAQARGAAAPSLAGDAPLPAAIDNDLQAANERLRQQLEQTRQSADELQNLIAAVDIATLLVDSDLRVTWCSPRLREMLALAAGDIERSLERIARRLDYPQLFDHLRSVCTHNVRMRREVPDQDGRWYLARLAPYRAGREACGAVLSLIDVSDRREAEDRARAGEAHMRRLAQSMRGYAIITMDPDGRVTSWNGGAETIFGFSEGEMLGQPVERIYSEQDRQQDVPQKERQRALADGSASDERWHLREDGQQIYCSGLVNPLLDGDRLLGFAKIARDLTEQKRQSSEQASRLEHAQSTSEQKDQFFAVLSHELKHPLNLIQLNSDLIIRAPVVKQSPALSKAARGIQAAVRSQSRIIDDLMDVSRLRTGKLKLYFDTLHYQALLEGIEAVFRPLTQADGVVFDSEHDPEPLYVEADPTRLEQIVWNLLNNAWKFTPPGGRISLRLSRDGEHARLEVSDTGHGISEDFLPKVFDLFGQAEVQHSQRGRQGLGIGLALVQQLVELHRGRIEAHSDGLGRGARFTVWLPLYLQAQLELGDQPLAHDNGQLQGVRILLVDDSPEVLEMLDDLLRSEGAEIETAGSGKEALARCAASRYDVILSDVGMPGLDGYQTISAIRAQSLNRHTPAIALSGYGSRDALEQARSAGFDLHLRKPVDLDSLVSAVRQVRRR